MRRQVTAEKTRQRRNRIDLNRRRSTPHVFVPHAGHPDLCSACNAGMDEEHRGAFIHVVVGEGGS